MCLNTRETKPSIAETDITVYKIIFHNNYSQVQRFEYEPNKIYEIDHLEIEISESVFNTVSEGFHAFKNLSGALLVKDITKGAMIPWVMKIVEFTIPKGSEYIISNGGYEIVSNKIISGSLKPVSFWECFKCRLVQFINSL